MSAVHNLMMNTNSVTQNYIGLSGAGLVLSEEQQFKDGNVQTANKLHKEGKLTEAKIIYEKVFNLDKDKFEVLHLLGTLEAQLGNFERAIDLLEQASLKKSHLWDTFFNLGNAYIEINNYDKAIINYNKSLKLKNNNDVIYNSLGRAFHYSKNFEEALKQFK